MDKDGRCKKRAKIKEHERKRDRKKEEKKEGREGEIEILIHLPNSLWVSLTTDDDENERKDILGDN